MIPQFPPTQRVGAIVLVHGAWVGEWCWAPILPALEQPGRMVRAVSLRGHGLRSSESGPHITLDDHVDDVVDLVETFDLEAITLVGHSYGGRVITRAWARLADRIEHMIYLDAHAPLGRGASGPVTGRSDAHDGMIAMTQFMPDPVEFGGSEAVDWFLARVRPQSASTVAADFAVDLPTTVDATYVAAVGDRDSPFAGYAEAARDSPHWRYTELACSHWLMVARPAEIAAIILDPSRFGELTQRPPAAGGS
jgi:pimeloyl-ACP methyl ester carboxylesterase